MIGDATKDFRKRGLDRKEDQMELMAWGFGGKVGDITLEESDRAYNF